MSRRLAFALLAMGTAQAAVYVARPMTSYRLLGLGEGPRAVGLVAAAFALVPLFLAIPLGRRADLPGGTPLIGAGCALQTLACLLLAAAGSPLTLAAASALLGLGHLGVALGAQAAVARESDEAHHDRHFGLLAAAVSLGQLAGPLLGGLVVGSRSGAALLPATEHAMLAAAAIAAAATAFALAAEAGRRTAPPPQGSTPRGSVSGILATPGVPTGIFASIAVLSSADVFTAYLPVLGEQRGIGAAAVGALLAVRAAASLTSRVGIGTLVLRVGRLRLMAVSALGAAAALVALTFAHDVVLLGVLSAAVGAALGFGQPLSMTMVVRLVPAHARATALAVRLTGNRIGQVAAPAAAGLVAGSAGTAAVFWLLAAGLVGSAAAVRRRMPERDGAAAEPA